MPKEAKPGSGVKSQRGGVTYLATSSPIRVPQKHLDFLNSDDEASWQKFWEWLGDAFLDDGDAAVEIINQQFIKGFKHFPSLRNGAPTFPGYSAAGTRDLHKRILTNLTELQGISYDVCKFIIDQNKKNKDDLANFKFLLTLLQSEHPDAGKAVTYFTTEAYKDFSFSAPENRQLAQQFYPDIQKFFAAKCKAGAATKDIEKLKALWVVLKPEDQEKHMRAMFALQKNKAARAQFAKNNPSSYQLFLISKDRIEELNELVKDKEHKLSITKLGKDNVSAAINKFSTTYYNLGRLKGIIQAHQSKWNWFWRRKSPESRALISMLNKFIDKKAELTSTVEQLQLYFMLKHYFKIKRKDNTQGGKALRSALQPIYKQLGDLLKDKINLYQAFYKQEIVTLGLRWVAETYQRNWGWGRWRSAQSKQMASDLLLVMNNSPSITSPAITTSPIVDSPLFSSASAPKSPLLTQYQTIKLNVDSTLGHAIAQVEEEGGEVETVLSTSPIFSPSVSKK